jgi:hypothetical protein
VKYVLVFAAHVAIFLALQAHSAAPARPDTDP